MNRRKMVDGLSWGACLAILLAMLLGLDRYQRPSLDGGYGPERRRYFSGTLERARELQETGRYRVQPEERWLLRGGWDEKLTDGREALAVERRARLVLPVLVPDALAMRFQLMPVPPEGGDASTIELEYGINGVELGRFVAPADGGVLNFRIEPALLHRGDNIVYLYRVTRRSDPGPWLSLGWMNVRVAGSES